MLYWTIFKTFDTVTIWRNLSMRF